METTGIVKKIGEVQTYAQDFQKVDFVVELSDTYEYQGQTKEKVIPYKFEIVQSRISELDKVELGLKVTVTWDIDGRYWEDPKTGEMKVFNSLKAWKVDLVSGPDIHTPQSSEPQGPPVMEDDIPF